MKTTVSNTPKKDWRYIANLEAAIRVAKENIKQLRKEAKEIKGILKDSYEQIAELQAHIDAGSGSSSWHAERISFENAHKKIWGEKLEEVNEKIAKFKATVKEYDAKLAEIEKESEVEENTVEDDGSNDDAEEDFLATYDASIDEDSETEELVDEPEEVKEMTYEANTYIYKGGSSKNTVKDFKTAVEAYDYLQKKAKRYAGTTDWAHSIDIWDGKHYSNIYRNDCNGNEQTTDAEIQVLIDDRDFEIEVNINAREAKLLAEDIDGNYGLAGEELFDFLVYYYEKTGTYFENAGIHARKVLKDWLNAKKTEKEISEYAVTPEAVEVAVQAEIDNAEVIGLLQKAEQAANFAKSVGKGIAVRGAQRSASMGVHSVLNEYAKKILGNTLTARIVPQAAFKDDKLNCSAGALYFTIEAGAFTIKGFKSVGVAQTSTFAKYDTFAQFDVALELIKERFNFPRVANNQLVVDMPETSEKIFVAYVLRFDGWSYHSKGEKFFKNAADAFNYLNKKHYKNDNWELVVESWDSKKDYYKYSGYGAFEEEHKIYTNSPDFDEYSTNAEIQKLIEERDAKAAADKIAEEKALAEEKARKEKLKQAETTCKALYDDWSKAKKRLADLRRYREQCKDAAKKAAYDLKIAELEKAFKPLDEKYNAAWDILIHSKANDFEAEI